MTPGSGRYAVAAHFRRWAVRDHADWDADAPIYDHRHDADAHCRRLNAASVARMNPTPTLFDKDMTMPEPTPPPATSIWDSFDDGDFRRDDKGRPLIVPPGETEAVPYRRATSYISVAEDDYGIHQWKRHLTVDHVINAWDDPDRRAWNDGTWHDKVAACQAAFVAAGGEVKANNGTRMHALTDALDKGEPLTATIEEQADLYAYSQAVAPFTLVHAEVKTVCDELRVAGTPDRVWTMDGWAKPRIGDLKTGKIDARKCAMQMALYAHSDLYDVATGQRTPLDVDQTVGLIIHLPYGEAKARVLEVDLVAGWEGVQLCRDIHAWRARNGMAKAWKAPAVDVDDLIAVAESRDDLLALRAVYRPHGLWTDAHDAAAKARTAALTQAQAQTEAAA